MREIIEDRGIRINKQVAMPSAIDGAGGIMFAIGLSKEFGINEPVSIFFLATAGATYGASFGRNHFNNSEPNEPPLTQNEFTYAISKGITAAPLVNILSNHANNFRETAIKLTQGRNL